MAVEWFKVFVGLPSHWKIAKLCELLPRDGPDIPEHAWRRGVLGLVVGVWDYIAMHAPNGDISEIPFDVIARHAAWHGDPERLLEALVSVKLIDRAGGKTRWHKWNVRNSALVTCADSTERTRRYRARLAKRKRDAARRRAAVKAQANGPQASSTLKNFLTPIKRANS